MTAEESRTAIAETAAGGIASAEEITQLLERLKSLQGQVAPGLKTKREELEKRRNELNQEISNAEKPYEPEVKALEEQLAAKRAEIAESTKEMREEREEVDDEMKKIDENLQAIGVISRPPARRGTRSSSGEKGEGWKSVVDSPSYQNFKKVAKEVGRFDNRRAFIKALKDRDMGGVNANGTSFSGHGNYCFMALKKEGYIKEEDDGSIVYIKGD